MTQHDSLLPDNLHSHSILFLSTFPSMKNPQDMPSTK